jgi:hypothetical protein
VQIGTVALEPIVGLDADLDVDVARRRTPPRPDNLSRVRSSTPGGTSTVSDRSTVTSP